MTRATPSTAFQSANAPVDIGRAAPAQFADLARGFGGGDLRLAIHNSLDAVEAEWRRFETIADCTAFQNFDWLAAWHRHVGRADGAVAVIVVGAYADGGTAFIWPLAVETARAARRLCWLGDDLCDYNAPLLARDFSARVAPERFLAAWAEVCARVARDPQLRPDWIELQKMPATLGAQVNPFTYLDVAPNPSGAHLTRLGDDWRAFYFDKRSSATRRHDRMKKSRMAAHGDIRFITSTDAADAGRTFEALMEQKERAFTRNGIPNLFARRGYRAFFRDLACNPQTSRLVHISRVEIGPHVAAANFGIVAGDRYYHVLASYDRDLDIARYGPGLLHLRELMAYAIGRGLKYFDFTIGDERYKLEWSDIHLALCDYSTAVTWRGGLANGRARLARRLKRFIKQTPLAWRLVGRLRPLLGGLRGGDDHHRDHPA